MNQQGQIYLKQDKVKSDEVQRGDIIMHEGQIWQCVIKNTNLFINIDSRQQKQININQCFKLNKLELIPHQWKMQQQTICLKGQQLGLGPLHSITLQGMKKFDQMQIIKSQTQKGKKVNYKVTLLQMTIKNKYLLISITFL